MTSAAGSRVARGGRIDRNAPLRFSFDGKAYVGFAGDTLASALLANGIQLVGRSFKFHRPRGFLSAGIEEPNGLFRVKTGELTVSNVRGTQQPLIEGLSAWTQSGWPSIRFDLSRVVDFTYKLWPAGFYNKTFKWPNWHWWEGLVRRAAGGGAVPTGKDPTQYFRHNLHCDVLIVGAGPAGMAAALAASRTGERVVIVEMESELGGAANYDNELVDGQPMAQWLGQAKQELSQRSSVHVLTDTMATGIYDHGMVLAVDRRHLFSSASPVERLWSIRCAQLILATGAIEQPLVFDNNDRPGIMLAGAVRRYLNEFGVTPGETVVVATNDNEAYRTAMALKEAGVGVPLIVDSRADAPSEWQVRARAQHLEVAFRSVITDTRGDPGVRAVCVRTLAPDGTRCEGPARWIDCNALAFSGGMSPTLHLFSQAGGRTLYDERLRTFVPGASVPRVHLAGSVTGEFDLGAVIRSGSHAGAKASSAPEMRAPAASVLLASARGPRRSPAGNRRRQWIDFRHDATVSDVDLAVQENFVSVEHLKRYTTIGMSLDQGKTSNLNALTVLAELTKRPVSEVGTTTFRPAFSPVSFGAMAAATDGGLYAPERKMPGHEWHVSHEGWFDDFGAWRRPVCYPRPGESRGDAAVREVRAVRSSVGIFEASPLGKIEVHGPDAAEFLNRIYMNNVLTLKPGAVRYGLMLNDNGVVIDDGVFARLASDHFVVNTSSGGAERICAWLEEWHQCEWPTLRIVLSPVTSQWGVVALAGANARAVLSSLSSDIDFSAVSFPHMSIRTGSLAGHAVRIQRVSYTGELTYEISVRSTAAESLMALLMQSGLALGIQPFGIDALDIMRIEKGFLHVGSDTDGTTNPLDVGFGPIVSRKREDFIGRRSLLRPSDVTENRRQLVGLEAESDGCPLIAGSHVVKRENGANVSEGFVTSACVSPTLGRPLGLAMLEQGFSRVGEKVTLIDNGTEGVARVCAGPFFDPRGERLHG